MVKGVVKCSSNCSNPELPGTVDIFTGLGTGTWNISAVSWAVKANELITGEYYIISPLNPADNHTGAPLNYIKVHSNELNASTVIYADSANALPTPARAG